MSQTNAQTALQAAVTVYAGSKGYALHTHITDLAYNLKTWLDNHDDRAGK